MAAARKQQFSAPVERDEEQSPTPAPVFGASPALDLQKALIQRLVDVPAVDLASLAPRAPVGDALDRVVAGVSRIAGPLLLATAAALVGWALL